MKLNRMDEILMRDLYHRIDGFDAGECTLPQLSDLLDGYLSLYTMVQVMPWMHSEYGGTAYIAGKIRRLAGRMYDRIRPGAMSDDLYAGYLADIMDAALGCKDEPLLQHVLDRSSDLLYRDGILRVERGFYRTLRLLCNCYYHVGENECADAVRRVVAEWNNERAGNGEWSGISVDESIQRLYVTDLFDAVTCEDRFSASVREGVSFYAARLLRLSGPPDTLDEKTVLDAGSSIRKLLGLSPYARYRSLYERTAELFGSAAFSARRDAGMDAMCFSVLLFCFFAEQDYRFTREQCESFHIEND